jgi:hypothetical protein
MAFVFDTHTVDKQYDIKKELKNAHQNYGASPLSQLVDIYRLGRGDTRLTDREYYYFRLYDPALAAEKQRMIGDNFRAMMQRDYLDPYWFAIAQDKLVLYGLLKAEGIAFPPVLALVHPLRRFAGAAAITSKDELGAFLSKADYPLFGKPVSGVAGVGTVSAEGYDAASCELRLFAGESLSLDALWEGIAHFMQDGYIFQPRVKMHPQLEAVGGPTGSTVRMVVYLGEEGAELVRCTWRVPTGGHATDNFARKANIIVAVDPETGQTRKAYQSDGEGAVPVEKHPDSGAALEGVQLPLWQEAVALCKQASLVYFGGKMQGWDVMIGADGPVIIELELDGGGPTLSQYAQQSGLLDDKLRRHLAWAKKDRARRNAGK